jgi:hypothetical protein
MAPSCVIAEPAVTAKAEKPYELGGALFEIPSSL